MSSKVASDPAHHLESSFVAKPPSDVSDEKYVNEKTTEAPYIAPLGAPLEDKTNLPFWKRFRRTKVDPDAIATQESSLDLDRSNLSQANTDNFLPDLGLNTNDYNLGNALFRGSFLIAELPSQLISKRLGPDRWIPIQMCAWSILAASQFWLTGKTSFLLCRVFLGFLQGGFIPDVILYLSYFYTKYELPLRLAIFWVSNHFCDIVSSFLATGLLKMRGVAGKEGWRWLFLIEGIFTLIIGIITFFLLPASPTQTKTYYRPHGWFTEREEIIMVNRIIRDDPGKGGMHNRQALSPRMLWKSFTDWDLWPIYLIGLTNQMPIEPPQTYLTLTLRNLGFDTTESNLLAVPPVVLGIFNLLLLTIISEVIHNRSFVAMIQNVWALPLLVALLFFSKESNQWAQYAVSALLVAFPLAHAIHASWASRNAGSVRTRTVATAGYNMMVQLSRIISAQIYRDDDKPYYYRGNRVLIGIAVWNIALYFFTYAYYRWRNHQRDKVWKAMTSQEQAEY
ncbi:hypothetical protein FRC19_003484, partial [Serendipita sp. 401]